MTITPMPWREIDGESPADRTRRLMHHKPELLEHVAGNLWNATSDDDRRFDMNWRETFAALSDEERAVWRQRVFDGIGEYEQQSPAEREMSRRRGLADTLAHNDEVYRRLMLEESK
jgi:hypothetical protein